MTASSYAINGAEIREDRDGDSADTAIRQLYSPSGYARD